MRIFPCAVAICLSAAWPCYGQEVHTYALEGCARERGFMTPAGLGHSGEFITLKASSGDQVLRAVTLIERPDASAPTLVGFLTGNNAATGLEVTVPAAIFRFAVALLSHPSPLRIEVSARLESSATASVQVAQRLSQICGTSLSL